MTSVTVVLFGEPVPFARSGHHGRQHFTPLKQRIAGVNLRIAAHQEMTHCGHVAFDEPLRIDMLAECAIPATWSKKKRQTAILQEIYPGKRPDIDNLYKLVADALNGVVYRDDALIVEARLRKVYGLQPKIVVTVSPLNGIARGEAADWENLRGCAPDATGELSSEDFVRQHRDEWPR